MLDLSANQRVLLTTSLLGCVAAIVGSYAVLRRRALVSDMVGHAAWPGICIGYLILSQTDIQRNSIAYFATMLAAAVVFGLLGVAVMTFVTRWTRTKEDAAIGIVLSVFFGAGIVLHSFIQNRAGAGRAGLSHFLEGHAATIRTDDLIITLVVFVVAMLVVALFYKEFKVFSFDPDFANSQGWPTTTIDLLMMGTLCIVTIMALPVVGVVLVTGMIIIPCAAARYWTNRLGRMLLLSGIIGAVSAVLGTALSIGALGDGLANQPSNGASLFSKLSNLQFGYNNKPLPTGPLIILCGTTVFVVSLLLAPERGALARLVGFMRLRRKVSWEHLLRSLYELNEPNLPQLKAVTKTALLGDRHWHTGRLQWLLWRGAAQGIFRLTGNGILLTASGLDEAAALTRRHRLWELFLIQDAGIAPDHVDRDADSIEHFLSPDLIEELEAELAAAGRLPDIGAEIPSSPHELTPADVQTGLKP